MQGNGQAGFTRMPVGNLPPEVSGYMQKIQLMSEIVAAMKEIPELASEKPTDQNLLTKVEFPEEGGVLTYMSSHESPYKGFPYFEFVDKIDTTKKLIRGSLSGLYHSLKKGNRLRLIFALPSIFLTRDLIWTGVYTFYKFNERFRIKSEMYSKAMRELYRAFDMPRENEDLETQDLRLMLKDVVCMFLEFDNAYRYRFQDIIVELDKGSLKRNPIKELIRLLDLMSSRELDTRVADSWYLAKLALKYYLRFDRKLTRMLADILSEINLPQVALTLEDKRFACLRSDYKFGFAANLKHSFNPRPEDGLIINRAKMVREYQEKRTESDQVLTREMSNLQFKQRQEILSIPEEVRKEVEQKVAQEQQDLQAEVIKRQEEISKKYFTEEQKQMLIRHAEEMKVLIEKFDALNRELASKYKI